MLNVNDSRSYNAVQQESSVLVAGVTWLLNPASAASSPQHSLSPRRGARRTACSRTMNTAVTLNSKIMEKYCEWGGVGGEKIDGKINRTRGVRRVAVGRKKT